MVTVSFSTSRGAATIRERHLIERIRYIHVHNVFASKIGYINFVWSSVFIFKLFHFKAFDDYVILHNSYIVTITIYNEATIGVW